MPLYEYNCQQCHRQLEKIRKFSDPPLTTCPYCGGELERTITAPAIQFKGAGWYKDLYSSAKPAAASASGESAAPASSENSPAPASSGGDGKAAAPAVSAPATTAGATGAGN